MIITVLIRACQFVRANSLAQIIIYIQQLFINLVLNIKWLHMQPRCGFKADSWWLLRSLRNFEVQETFKRP